MEGVARRSAKRAISLLQRATQANLQDPYRKGNVIELPKTGDLLLTGDIHGNVSNFKKLLEIADLENHPHRHAIFQELIHALSPDRDNLDLSFILLEWLAGVKIKYPDRAHILLGNHDHAELTGIEVQKYGRVLNPLFKRGLVAAYGNDFGDVHGAFVQFIRTFSLAARTPGGLFVSHSTPGLSELNFFDTSVFARPLEDGDLEEGNSVFNLVWGRDLSARTTNTFASLVGAEQIIVGHTPCEEGYIVPNTNLIVLDSKDDQGAYLLLPLGRRYSQADIVRHIHPVQDSGVR